MTWNKDYTWFSWFYGYSASFQGWLSDQLGSLHLGGETDLSTVTSRLDTIIKELQSSSGDTACSHTYQQEATQEATGSTGLHLHQVRGELLGDRRRSGP